MRVEHSYKSINKAKSLQMSVEVSDDRSCCNPNPNDINPPHSSSIRCIGHACRTNSKLLLFSSVSNLARKGTGTQLGMWCAKKGLPCMLCFGRCTSTKVKSAGVGTMHSDISIPYRYRYAFFYTLLFFLFCSLYIQKKKLKIFFKTSKKKNIGKVPTYKKTGKMNHSRKPPNAPMVARVPESAFTSIR